MAAESKSETKSKKQSPSNSQGSSTHPSSHLPFPLGLKEEEEVVEEDFLATPMDSTNPNLPSNSHDCFTAEEIAKYDKYEADFANYLRAKYFSDKDIYGGNIFDLAVKVDNEVVKASRRSPTQSYADPAQSSTGPGNAMASEEVIPSATGAVETSSKSPTGSVPPSKKSN